MTAKIALDITHRSWAANHTTSIPNVAGGGTQIPSQDTGSVAQLSVRYMTDT